MSPHLRVILDMLVSADGGIEFSLNPYGLGSGGSFGPEVQKQIDAQISTLLGG